MDHTGNEPITLTEEIIIIQKEMLMENRRLRSLTVCLIVLTMMLVIEPLASLISDYI